MKQILNRKLLGFNMLVLAVLLALTGCYPEDLTSTDQYDLVVTDYDREYFDSNSPRTYVLPDSLVFLVDPDNPDEVDIPESTQQLILDEIADNLNALGYTRLPDLDENNLPDVVVIASAVKSTWTGGGWYPWYPGWGWYPWYPGWGWGPGWGYPGYPVYYSYDTGTVFWQMIDPEESDEVNEVLGIVWVAGVNGLVRSSNVNNETAIRRGINKAFEQSPYLN